MLVNKHAGAERLVPNSANFPSLKHLWDMNNVSGNQLIDTVGTQHITTAAPQWYLDSEGFAKWGVAGGNWASAPFEAPGNRDFMLVACGRISWDTRALSIGGQISDADGPGTRRGISFDVTVPPSTAAPNAFVDANNYAQTAPWTFADDFADDWYTDPDTFNSHPNPDNPGIKGCLATVISPSAGTCKSYWAGRIGETAAYDPMFETQTHTILGSIQGSWSEIGAGWTMFPANRFEFAALMYFDSGAPLDMQDAITWMAQYGDIRLYPGWAGKK